MNIHIWLLWLLTRILLFRLVFTSTLSLMETVAANGTGISTLRSVTSENGPRHLSQPRDWAATRISSMSLPKRVPWAKLHVIGKQPWWVDLLSRSLSYLRKSGSRRAKPRSRSGQSRTRIERGSTIDYWQAERKVSHDAHSKVCHLSRFDSPSLWW